MSLESIMLLLSSQCKYLQGLESIQGHSLFHRDNAQERVPAPVVHYPRHSVNVVLVYQQALYFGTS